MELNMVAQILLLVMLKQTLNLNEHTEMTKQKQFIHQLFLKKLLNKIHMMLHLIQMVMALEVQEQ
jgi:hypothetical protein